MLRSHARVTADKAEQYLIQLCKHFAHRRPATYGEGKGRIEFESGTCLLQSAPGVLDMTIEAPDEEDLTRLEEVVKSHLQRFAFREPPEFDWTRG